MVYRSINRGEEPGEALNEGKSTDMLEAWSVKVAGRLVMKWEKKQKGSSRTAMGTVSTIRHAKKKTS